MNIIEQEIQQELKRIKEFIIGCPEYIPTILGIIGENLNEYRAFCENRNNHELREALGDAVHILGMKKKPSEKEMPRWLIRIKDAIFKNGINHGHHEGEKEFYKKYFKEDK